MRWLALFLTLSQAPDVKLERINALAKALFRDSAELPMNVDVTTVVTQPSGKVKRNAHAQVRMIFHGYKAGNFRVNAQSGIFDRRELWDSMAGDLEAFMAAGLLMSDEASIRQRNAVGDPVVVWKSDASCEPFVLNQPGKWLVPKHYCGKSEFRLAVTPSDELTFQHYTHDNGALPAKAKVPYLGDVTVQAFHVDVEFQSGTMPGDPKPFLWPKEVVTRVTTDKGTITVTNSYSPRTK